MRRKKSQNDRLETVYFDVGHPAGYGGVDRLSKATGVAKKKVQTWLKGRRTYTTHKPARRRYPMRKYVTRGMDMQWQADLVEMRPFARLNQGMNYLLTVIDIFSRYAWTVPLKRKTPQEIIRAFEEIFSQGRRPRYLQTDEGTEFENRAVRAFLSSHGVEQFSVKSPVKAAMVERFNRTLKTKMWRIFTHRGTYRWTDIIQQLTKAYNDSEHRILQTAPNLVSKRNEVRIWHRLYGDLEKPKGKTKFNIGDKVRISKVKGHFEKGYRPNWSEEIFTIHAINRKYKPVMYQIRDFRDKVIQGGFYDHELQQIDDSEKVYTIERIIRTRGQGERKEYLVKWLGYDKTSWIKHSSFRKLT